VTRALVDIAAGGWTPGGRPAASGAEDRPPLVFLHEGLGSVDLWRGFPDAVRDRAGGPAALVFSRHGYGRSDPAPLPARSGTCATRRRSGPA